MIKHYLYALCAAIHGWGEGLHSMHTRYALCLVLPLCLTACQPVELCDEPIHPHMAEIRVKFVWPAGVTNPADRPEYMHVIAGRPYNTWRNHGLAETAADNEPYNPAWNGLHPEGFQFPEDLKPEKPEEPEKPTDPDNPGTDPDNPGTDPDNPGTDPDNPGTDPENPGTDPENRDTDLENPDTDPENPTDPDTPETPDTPEPTSDDVYGSYLDPAKRRPFYLRNGEYNLITVNHQPSMEIEQLQDYLDRNELVIDSIYLRQLEKNRKELPEELKLTELEDFNPGFDYVMPFSTPVYRDVQLLRPVDTGGHHLIEFHPDTLSRTIRINFSLFKTVDNEVATPDGFSIESFRFNRVVAEISGVCSRTNLFSGFVSTGQLARTYFACEIDDRGGTETTLTVTDPATGQPRTLKGHLYRCSGRFNVLGLVYNRRANSLVGPGILHFAVNATMDEYNQNNGVKRKRKRVFYAGANPRKKFVEANILEQRYDGKYYLTGSSEVVIDFENPIVVDGTKILYNGDDVFWFKVGETIDVEI